MSFVEFHARSAFSFLEGASLPEALAETCAERALPAMALLDRDGVYGAPRFHLHAKKCGVKAHIGAEIGLQNLSPQRAQRSAKDFREQVTGDRGQYASPFTSVPEHSRADYKRRVIAFPFPCNLSPCNLAHAASNFSRSPAVPGITCSYVHCSGLLSGRQRRNLQPWRKRPPEK